MVAATAVAGKEARAKATAVREVQLAVVMAAVGRVEGLRAGARGAGARGAGAGG